MEGSTNLGLNVCDLQSQTWAQSLPLLLTSCVAMDRLFLFLKLQFLICKMNNMTALLTKTIHIEEVDYGVYWPLMNGSSVNSC